MFEYRGNYDALREMSFWETELEYILRFIK